MAVDGVPLLAGKSISKVFGGIKALHDVSIAVRAGEIVGLIGPNGAGKTTLFNCLNGQLHPDGGSVRFAGQLIDSLPSYKRARLGMARTFQRLEVFPELTVRAHVIVADRARRDRGRLWRDLLGMTRLKKAEVQHADAILEMVGLLDVADEPVASLSLGACRLVEIARALASEPKILMADEPSSGLDTRETEALTSTLTAVRRDTGMAILLVEHDLEMVASVVDRVVVLDFGHQIAEGSLHDVLAVPVVREAYLGTSA